MIDRRPITKAFKQMLETATGMPVGLVEPPPLVAGKPWGIIHSVDGGGYDGSLGDPNSDAAFVYQVDSSGRTLEQSEWMADLVRRTVLARAGVGFQVSFPPVPGVVVNDRRPDTTPGGASPEGEVSTNTRVYTVSERFSIHVTPST